MIRENSTGPHAAYKACLSCSLIIKEKTFPPFFLMSTENLATLLCPVFKSWNISKPSCIRAHWNVIILNYVWPWTMSFPNTPCSPFLPRCSDFFIPTTSFIYTWSICVISSSSLPLLSIYPKETSSLSEEISLLPCSL